MDSAPAFPSLESLIAAQDAAASIAAAEEVALYDQLSSGYLPTSPYGFADRAWPTPEDVLRANPLLVPAPRQIAAPVPNASNWLQSQLEGLTESLGRRLAERSLPVATQVWIQDAAGLLGIWTNQWVLAVDRSIVAERATGIAPLGPITEPAQPAPTTTTLRLIGPNERMAMREPLVVADPPEAAQVPRQTDRIASDALWSAPEVLLAQIEYLTHYPYTENWALTTLEQLRALVAEDRRDRGQAAALLAALSESSAAAVELAERANHDRLRVELLRAHWGLERRLDCWTAMRDVRTAAISEARLASRSNAGRFFAGWSMEEATQRKLESLSADLESYERFRDPHVGRRVAQVQRQMRTSTSDLDHALADAVEENYRNANVRVAITDDMLNRFLSQERVQSRPVDERIAGTPVRGQSETVSKSQITLQPAVGRWQMQMKTDGVVESNTSSIGRAKAYTHGSTHFTAHTPILVGPDGNFETQFTSVDATNCSQLVGVSTGLDWIPLIGSVARSQVVKEYHKKRPRAKSEIEFKVANRTREQVDARADELVADARQRVRERLTNPLSKYGIEITPLEMTTTSERIVARLRIASGDQLAAHTPRPRALSDSWASMQLHESAMTNAAVALELNGERLTAAQLQARMREKLPRLRTDEPPTATDTTVFQFASTDAVRFRVDDGRLELTMAIAEFAQQNTRIRNFIVHAFYVPLVNGLTAELVRDGALGIEGAVGGADRARLHNVFKVVLPEDRRLPIFRPEDPNDPRLQGLTISQLVLEDGWLGVSIGPDRGGGRVAERQRSLR
jgi:hypothetical protein